jgi:hypothetical protein
MGLVNFVAPPEARSAWVDEVISPWLQCPAEVHAEIKWDLRDCGGLGPAAAYRMARDRLLLAAVTDGRAPE